MSRPCCWQGHLNCEEDHPMTPPDPAPQEAEQIEARHYLACYHVGGSCPILKGDLAAQIITALHQAEARGREQMKPYLKHKDGCKPGVCHLDGFHPGLCKGGCTCGLDAALRALRTETGK